MCPRSGSCSWAQGDTLPAPAPRGRPPDAPPPEEHVLWFKNSAPHFLAVILKSTAPSSGFQSVLCWRGASRRSRNRGGWWRTSASLGQLLHLGTTCARVWRKRHLMFYNVPLIWSAMLAINTSLQILISVNGAHMLALGPAIILSISFRSSA